MRKMMMVAAATAFAMLASAGTANAGLERKCSACHHFTAANKVGPGLAGVIGRVAGQHKGFRYKFTKYIKGDAWRWDEAHLREWMCNSTEAIKKFTGDPHAKTKMPSQKICDRDKQDEVLTYLKGI